MKNHITAIAMISLGLMALFQNSHDDKPATNGAVIMGIYLATLAIIYKDGGKTK